MDQKDEKSELVIGGQGSAFKPVIPAVVRIVPPPLIVGIRMKHEYSEEDLWKRTHLSVCQARVIMIQVAYRCLAPPRALIHFYKIVHTRDFGMLWEMIRDHALMPIFAAMIKVFFKAGSNRSVGNMFSVSASQMSRSEEFIRSQFTNVVTFKGVYGFQMLNEEDQHTISRTGVSIFGKTVVRKCEVIDCEEDCGKSHFD